MASLDYAVNRSYSSGQGRFTTVDPIGMSSASAGNPQSNNLYAYVENNPIDFVDPSGLDGRGGTTIGGSGGRVNPPPPPNTYTVTVRTTTPVVRSPDAGFLQFLIHSREFNQVAQLEQPVENVINEVVNISADPDPIKVTDVFLLTQWYLALKKTLAKPSCASFIKKYLGGDDLLDVYLKVIGSDGIYFTSKKHPSGVIPGGQAKGAIDNLPASILLSKSMRFLGFRAVTSTLYSELAHSSSSQRSDENMAALLHQNGEISPYGLYKGPNHPSFNNLKTFQDRLNYQSESSDWWHPIMDKYCF